MKQGNKYSFVWLSIITIFYYSCTNDSKKNGQETLVIKTNSDFLQTKKFFADFFPSEINVYNEINDTLKKINFNSYYLTLSEDDKYELSKELLLKLCLSHLKGYHQGFDIYPMRKGEVKQIIDDFLVTNKIDTSNISNPEKKFTSFDAYTIEKSKKQKSKTIDSLIVQIQLEAKVIEIYYDSILKKGAAK